jgi:hypothetical protein
MRFLKVLKKARQKATSEALSTEGDDTNPKISPLSQQSKSMPGPSESEQPQEQTVPTPGILTGAHEFVIDRLVMGANQQFHYHYHGIPPSSREQLQAHAQESSRRSISRGSSDQGAVFMGVGFGAFNDPSSQVVQQYTRVLTIRPKNQHTILSEHPHPQ